MKPWNKKSKRILSRLARGMACLQPLYFWKNIEHFFCLNILKKNMSFFYKMCVFCKTDVKNTSDVCSHQKIMNYDANTKIYLMRVRGNRTSVFFQSCECKYIIVMHLLCTSTKKKRYMAYSQKIYMALAMLFHPIYCRKMHSFLPQNWVFFSFCSKIQKKDKKINKRVFFRKLTGNECTLIPWHCPHSKNKKV